MFVSAENYKDIDSVENEHPSAAAIVEVEGGWRVFETATDYETWQCQE